MLRTLPVLMGFSLLISACSSGKQADPIEKIPAAQVEKALRGLNERWDLNADGQSTCADITLLRKQQFSRLDTDKSSHLNTEEYRKIKFEDNSFVFFEFDTLDTDQTGHLNLTEFSAVSHSQFRGLDKDSDCTLSYRDAAHSVLEARRNGTARPQRPEDAPRKRRQGEEVDPF